MSMQNVLQTWKLLKKQKKKIPTKNCIFQCQYQCKKKKMFCKGRSTNTSYFDVHINMQTNPSILQRPKNYKRSKILVSISYTRIYNLRYYLSVPGINHIFDTVVINLHVENSTRDVRHSWTNDALSDLTTLIDRFSNFCETLHSLLMK